MCLCVCVGVRLPLLRHHCYELLHPSAVKNHRVSFPSGSQWLKSLKPSALMAGKPGEEGAWAWAWGLEDTNNSW